MIKVRATTLFCASLGVWICAAGPAFAQQTGSGLKGYWRGDDGTTPTTAPDQSGNGYNGTYTSGATTSTSVPTLAVPNPTSMLFNGSNSYINIPNFSFNGNGPITVAFWNYVATADVHNSSAFTIGNQDQPNRCHAHAPWGDKVIYWDYGNAADNSGRVHTDYTPYLDKWTHVTLVSTGTGGGFQAIYLDGVLKVQSTTPVGPTATFTGATLGAWRGTGLYHKSGLDDFRIYDRVLSAADITDLAAGKQGPAAPTGLVAVPGPGPAEISLTWNPVAGARCYNVKRSTVAGGSPAGTYTSIASSLTSPTFLDTGLTPGTTYYYVVSAVTYGEGPTSNEASCQPNPIAITPTTITVSEVGGTAGVTVTLLAGLTAGQTVSIPISSDDPAAGLVSVGAAVPSASTTLSFTGPTNVLTFTVTGQRDFVAGLPRIFHIKFGTVASSVGTYNGINYLKDVTCNETDGDIPGVIVSPVSAVAVNGGPPVTFTVQLQTIPDYDVYIDLGVTIPPGGVLQGTVSPPQLHFTPGKAGNWNTPQTVTVTPLLIDTTNTYVGPYAITLGPATSLDGNYSGLSIPPVPIQQASSIPPLENVWGGGGGCGLLGAEVLLVGAAVALLRRRRT